MLTLHMILTILVYIHTLHMKPTILEGTHYIWHQPHTYAHITHDADGTCMHTLHRIPTIQVYTHYIPYQAYMYVRITYEVWAKRSQNRVVCSCGLDIFQSKCHGLTRQHLISFDDSFSCLCDYAFSNSNDQAEVNVNPSLPSNFVKMDNAHEQRICINFALN